MHDVVVEFPVSFDETHAFGVFVHRFMESRSAEAEQYASQCDAPYFMMRSDPLQDRELKVLTFQQPSAAQAFTAGWALERSRLGQSKAA